MVNKGKGCISAIFNGSIPIGIIKHGLDNVFSKNEEPVEPSPIPGYTVLEAIYGNGKQYAVINYYANQNTKVEMQFAYIKNSSYAGCLYASRTAFQNNAFAFMPYVSDNNKTRSSFGKENKEFTVISGNAIHTVVQDGIYTYVDNELKTTHTSATFTAGNPMHILTQPGAVTTTLEAKIYYMKIWDNGTLVHDLIPALNNETGIAGLYDLVEKEFITSSTSTGFYPIHSTESLKYVENGIYANYTALNYTGSTWEDISNGRNMTLYNAVGYNRDLLRYEFDGSKQYGRSAFSSPTTDFTIEIYGSIPTASNYSSIPVYFGTNYSVYVGYGMNPAITTTEKRVGCYITPTDDNPQTKILYLNDILDVNVKTKFVFRRSKSDGKIYIYVKNINGEESLTDTLTTASISSSANFTVGTLKVNSSNSSDYRKGNIHAIRVYDRYLTDEEIAQNHAEDVRIYGE